jgi:tetratricopeptide (TPR) repeat protein
LRIVTPPANRAIMKKPELPAEPDQAAKSPESKRTTNTSSTEALRQMREAQRIEQQQEEDARQIKQTVTGSLSQRLAQAATGNAESGQQTGKGSIATSATANRQTAVVSPLSGPRVRMAPMPPQAGRNSGAIAIPSTGKLRRSTSSAVAEASGLREHPNAGLYIRLAASLLGIVLLGSGIYFYRQQNAADLSAGAGNRNLLSSEDESAKLIKVAEQARQQGENEAAAETLNKAIELAPAQAAPRQLLAETYETAGRPDEALKAYDGLLKVAPQNLGARLKVAEIHRVKGNVSEARSQYQRIISLGQNTPEASRAAVAIVEIDNTLAQMAAANNALFNSRPRRVAGQKRLGPILPPNTNAPGQIALIPQNPFALPNNNSLLTASPLREIEAPDPRTAAAYHKNQGTAYVNRRQFGAAIGEFQQALKLTPNDKDLYYFLGSSYYGIGQPLKAHEYYKKCDSGPYAETAQNGAKRTEKAARKEYERQQKELLNSAQSENAKQPAAPKNVPPGKGLQNSFQER